MLLTRPRRKNPSASAEFTTDRSVFKLSGYRVSLGADGVSRAPSGASEWQRASEETVDETVAEGPRAMRADGLGNWGRWGQDDERGAANLITPAAVQAAASLVRSGRVYPLGLPIRRSGVPVHPIRTPPQHFMSMDGGDYAAGAHLKGDYQAADDYLFTACHGGTHVDALAHSWYDGLLYNGHSANRVRSYGATRCGIENCPSIVTRGVLLDIATMHGVDHLPRSHVITVAELEQAAHDRGLEIRSGDTVLIRTGWLTVFAEDEAEFFAGCPGIGLEAGRWLARHDIVAAGADNMALEVETGTELYEGGDPTPEVHKLLLRDCGVYILELLDLEELRHEQSGEFLFVLAPLRIWGGVGSPVNPVAIC
jgi:kynurenine formamidase